MTKRNIKYFFKKLKAAKIKFHSPSQKKNNDLWSWI